MLVNSGDWVSWERQAMAVSIWSNRLSLSTWRARMSVIACSMADIRSSSMADRYELDECGVSGGKEGVFDREHVDPSEPGVGAENRTMMRVPRWTRSFLGDPFLLVRATAPELAGDPKFRYITNQLVDNTHLAGDPKRKGCRSLLG